MVKPKLLPYRPKPNHLVDHIQTLYPALNFILGAIDIIYRKCEHLFIINHVSIPSLGVVFFGWVGGFVRLIIFGSVKTIRDIETVVGVFFSCCVFLSMLGMACGKNTVNTRPIQNTRQTTSIIYEFTILDKCYIYVKANFGSTKRIECLIITHL